MTDALIKAVEDEINRRVAAESPTVAEEVEEAEFDNCCVCHHSLDDCNCGDNDPTQSLDADDESNYEFS